MSLYPGSSTYPGSAVYPSQGDRPMHEVLISFDDASEGTPTWHYITEYVRGYTIHRGRANELDRVDAGTESITLDNRDRRFDPTNAAGPYYPNVTPMNRIWHRVRYAGETIDLFKGYVESWPQAWPGQVDAVATVTAVDEFKVLALDHLPTTDPPRDSYADVIAFDAPAAYWRMGDDPSTLQQSAVTGPVLTAANGGTFSGETDGAIVGEADETPFRAMSTWGVVSDVLDDTGETPNLSSVSVLTVETWVKFTTFSGSTPAIVQGPIVDGFLNEQYAITIDSTGHPKFTIYNGTSTGTATGSVTVVDGNWHHIVGTWSGGTMTLYADSVAVATASLSGAVAATGTSNGRCIIGFALAGMLIDEVAIYRVALTADRVIAHYAAGSARGFGRGQTAGARIGAVLDVVGPNRAPRDIQAGVRTLQGRYMTGQDPLGELRVAEAAEAVDAVLYVARTGALKFLDSGHRSSSPYDAAVVTLADDGTPGACEYFDIQVDYSDSYLANQWNVTRTGGTTQTASDTTSIARYLKRPQSLTDLAVTEDTDASDVANAMLAKYKDPFLRVVSVVPQTSDNAAFNDLMARDIGDRIRVIRTPPGGGDPIDTEVFLQGIEATQAATDPFPRVTWNVSPV